MKNFLCNFCYYNKNCIESITKINNQQNMTFNIQFNNKLKICRKIQNFQCNFLNWPVLTAKSYRKNILMFKSVHLLVKQIKNSTVIIKSQIKLNETSKIFEIIKQILQISIWNCQPTGCYRKKMLIVKTVHLFPVQIKKLTLI